MIQINNLQRTRDASDFVREESEKLTKSGRIMVTARRILNADGTLEVQILDREFDFKYFESDAK